jgi:outer membrane lipoprotein carrier protein
MKSLRYIILFLICSLTFTASAETLTAKQQQDAITKINASAAALKSMDCSFVQTKNLSMLNEKMVSKGRMVYRQSDKLRWEYTSPYQYLFIFNGTKVYVGNKSRKDVIDTNSNKVFKEVARIMMNTVTGKALSNQTDFTVSVASNGSTYVVTLVPKKKDLKQMFSKIVLTFTKLDIMISEVDIYEKNGDRSNIVLKNIVTNTPVNESLFAIPK